MTTTPAGATADHQFLYPHDLIYHIYIEIIDSEIGDKKGTLPHGLYI